MQRAVLIGVAVAFAAATFICTGADARECLSPSKARRAYGSDRVRVHYNCWVRKSTHKNTRVARDESDDPPPKPKKPEPMIVYPPLMRIVRKDLAGMLSPVRMTMSSYVYDIDKQPLHQFTTWENRVGGQFQ